MIRRTCAASALLTSDKSLADEGDVQDGPAWIELRRAAPLSPLSLQ